MTDNQKMWLEKIVESNEEIRGARFIIDYAILLACSESSYTLSQEMIDYVESLYVNKYDGLSTKNNK